jgi:thiol-disulfide isomerase/thioredoxin
MNRPLRRVFTVAIVVVVFAVGSGLGFVCAYLYVRKQMIPDRAIKFIEFAEWARGVTPENRDGLVVSLEDEAYLELHHLAYFYSGQIQKLSQSELEALQRLKGYCDRFEPLDSEGTDRIREQMRAFLDQIPWSKDDMRRKTFFAQYSDGKRELLPKLKAVTWLSQHGAPSTLSGKVVLLAFWGIRCGRCLNDLARLNELYEEYADWGLEIVAIHAQPGDADDIQEVLSDNRCQFPACQGESALYTDLWVPALPSYLVIDRKGCLAWGPEYLFPSNALLQQLLGKQD